MKNYVEILLSRGQNITDQEVINYILDGLDSQYDPIVASLATRLESKFETLTLQKAQFLVQKHELRLERAHQALNSGISLEFHGGAANSVNVVNPHEKSVGPLLYVTTSSVRQSQPNAQQTPSQSQVPDLASLSITNKPNYPQQQNSNSIPQSFYCTPAPPNRSQPAYPSDQVSQFQYSPNPARGRGRGYGRGRVICPVCNGHMALQCYYRYSPPTDNISFSCTLNLYTIKLSLISRLFSHLSLLFFHCVQILGSFLDDFAVFLRFFVELTSSLLMVSELKAYVAHPSAESTGRISAFQALHLVQYDQ